MSFLSELFQTNVSPLLESAGTKLFDDMRRIAGELPAEVVHVQAAAKATLKRADRITWFLRLWKVGYLKSFVEHYGASVPQGYADRVVVDFARRARVSEEQARNMGWAVFHSTTLLESMKHFLALPIPAIQKHVFSFEDPETILANFNREEREWQNHTKGAFLDEDATEIMRFPNGLAWFDLGRASCEKEGQYMGNGGNLGTDNPNETILSLRETHEIDGSLLHKPILTFILDQHGLLHEMKGRNGLKPSPQYYNEIVALLRDDRIVGMTGGTYQPEESFSLDDLPAGIRDELLAEKPALGGLYALYKLWGATNPVVYSLIKGRMRELGIKSYVLTPKDDRFVVMQFENFQEFIRSVGDGIVRQLFAMYEGKINVHGALGAELSDVNEDQITTVIRNLDTPVYAKFMRALGIKAVAHHDPRFDEALKLAAKRLHGTDMADEMSQSIFNSLGTTSEARVAVHNRLRDYVSAGWVFRGGFQEANVTNDYSAKIDITISAEDLVGLLTADSHDTEYKDALEEMRTSWNGRLERWSILNDEEMASRREEEGLSPEVSGNSSLDSDEVIVRLIKDGKMFDPKVAAGKFAAYLSQR